MPNGAPPTIDKASDAPSISMVMHAYEQLRSLRY